MLQFLVHKSERTYWNDILPDEKNTINSSTIPYIIRYTLL